MSRLYIFVLAFISYFIYALGVLMLMGYALDMRIVYREEVFTKLDVITNCVLAPLWEEAMYRWAPLIIAYKINKEIVWPTAIFMTLTFGWAHGYGMHGIYFQGMMGLFCSFVFIKCGMQFRWALAFHILWNILCLLLLDNFNFTP
jgi:hypothetical protein